MTIKVYHLNIQSFMNEHDQFINEDARKHYCDITMFGKSQSFTTSYFESHYKLAAILATDNPNVAFEKTNHIESDWGDNEEVTWSCNKRKSSSVGDIFQHNDGSYLMVAGCGFEPVNVG